MKKLFTAVIVRPAPTAEYPNAVAPYSHLRVVATDEEVARKLVEQHLFERRPLGFSEREMRKRNPKRTPWRPGLEIGYLCSGIPADGDPPIGVIMD